MTTRLSIVQLGIGTIGQALVDQVRVQRPVLLKALGLDLRYAGIAGRSRGAFAEDGIDLSRWRDEVGGGLDGAALLKRAFEGVRGPKVFVDATAADGMAAVYGEALSAGFHLVSCNKRPLSGPLADYLQVKEAARRKGRFWLYEVTVGAGLPVIGTLRDLLDSGDKLESIEGCLSGTLNFLSTGLDSGGSFSEVLARARELGYTEPDPRDDLGGMDVARKALILAREAGMTIEPEQVRVTPFCVTDGQVDAGAFMAESSGLDADMDRLWKAAAARGRRLRYVASIDGGCAASLKEVPADGPLGRLSGPENIFVLKTRRYANNPLVVAGPGAGPAVTAAGAFADVLRVGRALAGQEAIHA